MMQIMPVNNNNYNKPSFRKIVLQGHIPNSVLKEFLNNSEFVKSAQQLHAEGEDLFVSFCNLGILERLVLTKGRKKPAIESIEFIDSTHSKDNKLETAIRNYSDPKNKLSDINNFIKTSF